MIDLAARDSGGGEGWPSAAWTNPRIREWASSRGLDLGGATVKADMLAVIGEEP